ncbi:hypothetical protein SEA_KELA_62 [Streptomyces phage Kela]|nr:hypothetical protein SEA_KELA_62 [Streptomyces phage Kela]
MDVAHAPGFRILLVLHLVRVASGVGDRNRPRVNMTPQIFAH